MDTEGLIARGGGGPSGNFVRTFLMCEDMVTVDPTLVVQFHNLLN